MRFRIFETYCLPSVRQQSNQSFIWCVCFDVDTPEPYKSKIESLSQSYANFKPIFVDGFSNAKTDVIDFVKRSIPQEKSFIITTRLDNDDIIHKDFIKTIQDLSIPKHHTAIDLSLGYQLINVDETHDVLSFKNPFNAFVSLVESSQEFETVIAKQHREWQHLTSKVVYTETAMWIQFIHEQNIINSRNKSLKQVDVFNPEDFGLNLKLKIHSDKLYNLKGIPFRFLAHLKKWIKNIFR